MGKFDPLKGVFFDWDGTLVKSYQFLEKAHNAVLGELGMPPLEKDAYKKYFGKPREFLYKELYGHLSDKAQILFTRWVADNVNELGQAKGASDLLELLQSKSIPMAVVTNKRPDVVALEIKHFGWDGYFDVVIGAGEAEHDKPAADPLLLALSKMNDAFDPHEVVLVGDTESDLGCAQNAGIRSIFINDMNKPVSLAEDFGVFHMYDNLYDFYCDVAKNL